MTSPGVRPAADLTGSPKTRGPWSTDVAPYDLAPATRRQNYGALTGRSMLPSRLIGNGGLPRPGMQLRRP